MTTTPFHKDWTVRPKASIFAELSGPGAPRIPVTLPHDAMIDLPRNASDNEGARNAYFPGGAVEYTKVFDVPEDYRTRRLSLEFQGVYRDAVVFVNGDFAGQRPSGYATFRIRLDPFLRYGESNVVRVESRAHDDSRWYTGLGIHRDVLLHVDELVHLAADGVQITTPDVDHRRAVVLASSWVLNEGLHSSTVTVTTEVRDADDVIVSSDTVPVTTTPGTAEVSRQRLYVVAPHLWSPDSPYLYTATTTVRQQHDVLDQQVTRFGVRTLQLDPYEGLRINGTPLKLRGACIHHDNGILGAATIGRAEERRIEVLKAAGFNAIRSSHNPISQPMLDACDRLGMLVMDETFDMWSEAKNAFDYSLAFPEWWERDVEAMVAKDFNHPSVIIYSIGNEVPETGRALGSGWGRRLAEKVRSLDPSRFITNGINGLVSVMPDVIEMMSTHQADADPQGVNTLMGNAGEFMNQVSSSPLVTEKTAESQGVLDIAGINYGEARYEIDKELFPHRVIVGTETFPTRIDANWKLVTENPHVIGDFTWTGWDYLGEVGIGRVSYPEPGQTPAFAAPFPWLTAWCGDIDITGHRRPASYYRETVFGLRREPYIAVHRPEFHGRAVQAGQWAWSDSIASWTWTTPPGAPVTIDVYSDADEVELFVNGTSCGRRSAGQPNGFTATFETTYEPGQLVARAYIDGAEVGRTVLTSARGPFRLSARADSAVITDGMSALSFIEIEVVDDRGVVATHEEHVVSVQVDGAGILQGLGSARPATEERYGDSQCTTFDGRLLAAVRPTAPGEITVVVSADGFDDVSLSIHVVPERVPPVVAGHLTDLNPQPTDKASV
ncbi:glycoside hydrolase family 2 TIM barrel-domain containing protein [Curtobacterium sp. ISL-83]|uniref:glycoside hydrolase family 2 TIM barrel-domain containing protein n=1 Tax=Curtobacterium sp. ISL-83 TaxID=2819145 RepID=UPI001BEA8068|nr:glycoside hydrolase family 2 TIM barrel-domain containing protein [Curtobacterium sp. ISL-83]MBT2502331.1 DUF4982 domain-containing protein [Curtobacterium sp. ISL-83]